MKPPADANITQLLLEWREGNKSALDDLMPLVYDELRQMASHYMRGQKAEHTLQTTALVNEAYLKLVDSSRVRWQDRAHFFAISAQLMRRILVDSARSRNSLKRGGDIQKVELEDDAVAALTEDKVDLILLDEALKELAGLSPRQSKVVELKYFGGLTEAEIAETLEISTRTVKRDWSVARAWLFRKLGQNRLR